MAILSKSSFVRGTQCHKSLYLHFDKPELKDQVSENQQHIFNIGHGVGSLAQQVFPGGIDASRGNPHEVSEALDYTQQLIASGQQVIYEAAFSDGQTLCYMDILVFRDGGWEAFEVKASTRLKEYHLTDTAFQYHVIRASGLDLAEISLMHLNNTYIRRGNIDVNQLFTAVKLTAKAKEMQADIQNNLLAMQEMLRQDEVPDIEIGHQCTQPFSCDFYGFCHQDERPDIFTGVKSVSKAKIEKLRQAGVNSLKNIPDSIRFTAKEWIILKAILNDEINYNKPALEAFVSQLQYPYYFIDFESVQPPIPLYDASKPYQQIPFQYSLHILNNPGQALIHKAFLGTPPTDPRPEFINTMLEQLGIFGSIIVYNKAFESSRIRELARDFPAFEKQLLGLLPRIVDLMVPFKQLHLNTPAMKGSYSIKAVLPALVSELSYAQLGIQDGGTASLTYMSLYEDTDCTSIAAKRSNLLAYCKLDSLAMVALLKEIS